MLLTALLSLSPLGGMEEVYSMTYLEVEQSYPTRHYFCNEENQASVQVDGIDWNLNSDFFADSRIKTAGIFFTNCNDSGSVREIQVYFERQGMDQVIDRFETHFGRPKTDERTYKWMIDEATEGIIVTRPYMFTYIERKVSKTGSAEESPGVATKGSDLSSYTSMISCVKIDNNLFSLSREDVEEYVKKVGGMTTVLPADLVAEVISVANSGKESGAEYLQVIVPSKNLCGPETLTSLRYILAFEKGNGKARDVFIMMRGVSPDKAGD